MTESLSLADRVTRFVASNPGLTLREVARGVRARTVEVLAVLTTDGFLMERRGLHPADRAQVYYIASAGRERLGRAARRSQSDLVARVLLDGERHSTSEIHRRCGFSRLNSRVAELRSTNRKRSGRGMDIRSFRSPDVPSGPEAYEYQFFGFRAGFDSGWLFGTSEASDGVASARRPAAPSLASDASTVDGGVHSPVSPSADGASGASVQLRIGEAA